MILGKMDHCFIKGFHGGDILYLKEEKHLFYRKIARNGNVEYACYQSILLKNKKRSKSDVKVIPCTARAIIHGNECSRNKIKHSKHDNHELIFRDLETLNAVKEKCKILQEINPIVSHKASAKIIFLQEMAK